MKIAYMWSPPGFYWFPSSGLGTRSGSSSFPELIRTLQLGNA